MHIINITVRNKVAVNPAQDRYVCGNSDYIVRFDFDAEWDAFETKTARFVKEDGSYVDQLFSGNDCPLPKITDTYKLQVGVYAGDLSTTTAAYVPCKKSILCGGGVPADPAPDVYNQIMAKLNSLDSGGNIADPGEAHQMLVSDAQGKAVWEDRLAYKTTGEGVLLAETTITAAEGDPGMFLISTPWEHSPVVGGVCTVTYNGTAYECTGVDASEMMGVTSGVVAFGKTDLEGGNPDAPFLLAYYAPNLAGLVGGFTGMVVIMDGNPDSVTVSVTGQYEVLKKVDKELLPDTVFKVSVPVTIGAEVTFGAADKTFAQLKEAYNAGCIIRVVGGTELFGAIYGDVRAAINGDNGLVLAVEMYTSPYLNEANRIVRAMMEGNNGEIVFNVLD